MYQELMSWFKRIIQNYKAIEIEELNEDLGW